MKPPAALAKAIGVDIGGTKVAVSVAGTIFLATGLSRLWYDNTRIRDLGWSPSIDYETSLKRTAQWFSDAERSG